MLRGAFIFGGLALAFAVASLLDPRVLPTGEDVWLKPLRFALAFAVHALTLAWLWRLADRHPESDRLFDLACRLQLAVMVVELACVALQGARGVPSHFNVADPFDAAVFTIMGIGTYGLFIGYAGMALNLLLRPGPSRLIDLGILCGLALSVAGGLVGVAMVAVFNGHGVGPGGGELAFFGWRISGGDLRVPHFVGIHALQALPAIAWLLSRTTALASIRWIGFAGGSSAYLAAFAAILALALEGRSVFEIVR